MSSASLSKPVEDHWFDRLAERGAVFLGSTGAWAGLWALTGGWLVVGWGVGWLDTWQITYTTAITIVTQSTTQLIQRTTNRFEARAERHYEAMERKMDELVAALRGASNQVIGLEHREEPEFRRLQGKPPAALTEDP